MKARLNKSYPGVSVSDTVANEWSIFAEYRVPARTVIEVLEGAEFRLTLKDSGGTELPDDALVMLAKLPADHLRGGIKPIMDDEYGRWKNANQYDVDEVPRVANGGIINEFEYLVIMVKSSTAVAKANSNFSLEVEKTVM